MTAARQREQTLAHRVSAFDRAKSAPARDPLLEVEKMEDEKPTGSPEPPVPAEPAAVTPPVPVHPDMYKSVAIAALTQAGKPKKAAAKKRKAAKKPAAKKAKKAARPKPKAKKKAAKKASRKGAKKTAKKARKSAKKAAKKKGGKKKAARKK